MKNQTNKKLNRLEKTAYHEAGHAVLRILLKLPFVAATIETSSDSYGHVSFKYPKRFDPENTYLTPSNRIYIENEIVAGLAGQAAELIASGKNNRVGSNSDRQRIIDLAMYLTGSEDELEAYINWLQVRTYNMLKKRSTWYAVELVAKYLLRERTIRKAKVKSLVQDAMAGIRIK